VVDPLIRFVAGNRHAMAAQGVCSPMAPSRASREPEKFSQVRAFVASPVSGSTEIAAEMRLPLGQCAVGSWS